MTEPRYIEHIIEPDRLLLSWQPPRDSEHPRTRMFVAELLRNGNDADLTYLLESDDYKNAMSMGFGGYPGFSIEKVKHSNVLAAFMRRLPPRSRNDFGRFLTALRLNADVKDNISDFALLGYSGAKLPGDGFCVINTFENAQAPFEFLTNVEGYSYYKKKISYDVNIGDSLGFNFEPDNKFDNNAVAIMLDENKIGYVCRGLNCSFAKWIKKGLSLQASIERINGTKDKPKLYALVKFGV